MGPRPSRTLLITAIAATITLALHGQTRPVPQDRDSHPIRLRAATFTPARGESPPIRADLMRDDDGSGAREYIVQFEGPVREPWKAALAASGAELLHYIPDFAIKVRMSPAAAARIARLPFVAWMGPFHPAYRIDPAMPQSARRAYVARLERGTDRQAAEAALAAAGVQILRRTASALVVSADPDGLDAVVRSAGVASVEPFVLRRKHNEFGGAIVGGGLANDSGYDGSTQTIAVADTGLGGGSAATAHGDLPAARIRAIANWPGAPDFCFSTIVNDGAADVDTGHGTHVATSALGGGDDSGSGRGTAPGAGLVFQSIENWAEPSLICSLLYGIPEGYYLVGIPDDIGDLFRQAYDAGARVHSDSWGSEVAGAYTTDSANADAFIWSHRDLAVTVSAGNSGVDADGDGVVDPGSINAPATAKNVITVGASENDRQADWACDTSLSYTPCAAQGGQNTIFTYGGAWPERYPANPLRDDPSAGNAEQLAAFSSRGPTVDGRIKPDVVAPGTWVLSGYSDQFQQQYDPSPNPRNGLYQYDGWGIPRDQAYKYMGGTSMSAPLVAGAAAVVRDFYEKAHAHPASAALVKATLINSAVDLLDENNDGVFDNAHPIPNGHEGWGRVDLGNATDGSHQFVDESTALATGDQDALAIPVAVGGAPFKVTLVWTDYPSTPTAGANLVNDLDLVLVGPDGTTYLGNVFAAGWSVSGGQADRTNNVENIYLPSAAAGLWTVLVRGYNVPYGPQPFALIVDTEPQAPGGRPVVRAFVADGTAAESGPTTGSIRVARTGDPTEALVVTYTVGGTATAGSDFETLAGSVTIPEGQSDVLIPVVALDDWDVEPDETVILTLVAGASYDVGSPATASVAIISDDLPPDLTITSVTTPGPAAAGGVVTITDTTQNKGTAPSPASETGFYLSTNGSLDAADVFLGSRAVLALSPGTSEARTTALTLPVATMAGSYYVLAKADWAAQIPETVETNNVRASASFRVGPDLVVSAMTAPATAAAGEPLLVSDTTFNQGADTAPASVTAFYLSVNSTWDASDVLVGSRAVAALAPATSDAASTSVVIPASTAVGSYYVLARADGQAAVAESLENNNTRASSVVRVGADLTVTAVTAPTAAGAGSTIVVTDTTKNQGGADSPASTTSFYLSINTQIDAADALLGARAVPPLEAGGSAAGSVSLSVPAGTPAGSYYIVAKADAPGVIAETSEFNNTRTTSAFRVGPDLTVTTVAAPASGDVGEAVSVTVTVRNIGGGPAPGSLTAFHLSLNTTLDAGDVALGERPVPALDAGALSQATISLVIPASTAAGSYYVLATVDPANGLAEVYENNNTENSAAVRIGPDLAVTALSAPTTARAGSAVSVTDTTRNQGGGDAPASSTSFYLSTNSTLDPGDVWLGSRVVAALQHGASQSATTPVTVPLTTAPGSYYLIAKADDPATVAETTETNNTRARALRVDPP